ncbi:S1 family peptidase [Catellatospora tritici]|uniref:S1 family peptidase n=1 Tax=Catellatospora tritici TaxID=2851566 RepID=UPI001C2DCEF3|nr:S1 family peptidase [Catellatospora tritici]MBV1852866.1 S1 family peptidase [Catellatospora tritici]
MARWKRLAFGAGALVLAIAVLPPGAATAARQPPAAAAAAPAAEDPFAEEAVGFAKERGISEAEARKRMSWQLVAPDLDERLQRELGTRYGNVWIDVRDGDRVKAGVTGSVDDEVRGIVKAAAAAVGLTDGYDVVAVKRSAAKLAADNDWLADQIIRTNVGVEAPLSAGIRTDLNALMLHVPRTGTLTAAQKDLITTAQARLGAGLVLGTSSGAFKTFACDVPYCDKPLRGGVKINHPSTWCTAGFIAQSKVDSVKYVVTAGHCAYQHLGTWSSKNVALTSTDIGPVHHWIFDTYIGDMAIIRINDSSATGWNPQPWVLVTLSFQTTENTTYHIASDNMSVVGMRICTTGAATRVTNCSHVEELGLTASLDGLTMRNLGLTENCGKPGDSGAPMFASHVGYGILVGGDEDDCEIVYQGIRTAERELNVNILH